MKSEPRKSYIEKSLEVKINIGNFSTVGASVGFGEEIEWSSKEDRAKKLEAISQQLRKELKKDVSNFLADNNLSGRTDIMVDSKIKKSYKAND